MTKREILNVQTNSAPFLPFTYTARLYAAQFMLLNVRAPDLFIYFLFSSFGGCVISQAIPRILIFHFIEKEKQSVLLKNRKREKIKNTVDTQKWVDVDVTYA